MQLFCNLPLLKKYIIQKYTVGVISDQTVYYHKSVRQFGSCKGTVQHVLAVQNDCSCWQCNDFTESPSEHMYA